VTLFCESHCILLIKRAVCVSLVEVACFLLTYLLDVVFFASGVFRVVVVDVIDNGDESGSNIKPAILAYVIEKRVCLRGQVDILALRVPIII
jgi:hypothetical protein